MREACDDDIRSPAFTRQDRAHVSVYDPVFAEEDIALLDTLGVTRLTEDRACRHRSRLASRHR